MAEIQRLADLARNGRERLRVSVSEFKGTRYADVRIFATDKEGGLVPTKQGVSIRAHMIQETIRALQEAELLLQDGARLGK